LAGEPFAAWMRHRAAGEPGKRFLNAIFFAAGGRSKEISNTSACKFIRQVAGTIVGLKFPWHRRPSESRARSNTSNCSRRCALRTVAFP
jgi:hypothetical protein